MQIENISVSAVVAARMRARSWLELTDIAMMADIAKVALDEKLRKAFKSFLMPALSKSRSSIENWTFGKPRPSPPATLYHFCHLNSKRHVYSSSKRLKCAQVVW